MAGGNGSAGILNYLLVYDPGSDSWSSKALLPTARRFPAAAVIDGQFYVVGGMALNGDVLDILEVYIPATTTWSRKVTIPTAVSNAAAANLGGRLYVFGGQDANGEILNRAFHSDAELFQFQGILGHWHITTKKIDPGPAFDWCRILRALKGAGIPEM